MLAALHRMRSSADFQRVRRNGKKVVMAGLIVHVYTGLYPGRATQVGLTVGKDCGLDSHLITESVLTKMKP